MDGLLVPLAVLLLMAALYVFARALEVLYLVGGTIVADYREWQATRRLLAQQRRLRESIHPDSPLGQMYRAVQAVGDTLTKKMDDDHGIH